MHTFVNDLERSVGTCLYGRRMYEVMVQKAAAACAARRPKLSSRGADLRFEGYSLVSIRIDRVTYDHDVIIDLGKIRNSGVKNL